MTTPSTKDLQGSGPIRLSEIKAEFGKGNNLLSYLGEGGVTSSAPLKLTDFYGTSSGPPALISLPAEGAVYSEWYSGKGSTWGTGVSLGSDWYFGSESFDQSTTDAIQLTANTVLQGNRSYKCIFDIDFAIAALAKSGSVSIAAKNYANTLLTGHNNAQQRLCIKLGNGLLTNTGGRQQGEITFQTRDQTPYQIGVCVTTSTNAGKRATNMLTIHSLIITDVTRGSIRDVIKNRNSEKSE